MMTIFQRIMPQALCFLVVLFACYGSAITWTFAGQIIDCKMSAEKKAKHLQNYSQLPVGVDKPLPGCSGFDDVDPGFLNANINGVNFRVPRDDILSPFKNEADGPIGNLVLIPRAFNFGIDYKRKKLSHYVQIHAPHSFRACVDEGCLEVGEKIFLRTLDEGLGLELEMDRNKINQKGLTYYRKLIEKASTDNLTGRFIKLSKKQITGSFKIENGAVKAWILCNTETKNCGASVKFQNRIWVTYRINPLEINEMAVFWKGFLSVYLPKIVVKAN